MRTNIIYFLIIFSSCFILNCEENESKLPICKILSPLTNSKVVNGNRLKVIAVANSSINNIKHVIFFIDNKEVGTVNTPPYKLSIATEDYLIGIHVLKAKAVDYSGLSSEYEINIEIIPYIQPSPLTDLRNGNTYEVVEIGEQVWMAENLRYKTEITLNNPYSDPLLTDLGVANANNNQNISEEYGYLYITKIGTGEGVCPDEWHVPSREDWEELFEYLGGKSMAALRKTGYLRLLETQLDFSHHNMVITFLSILMLKMLKLKHITPQMSIIV